MGYPPIDPINFPNPTTSQISQTQSLTGWSIGGFHPPEKYQLICQIGSFPPIFRGENSKKYLRTRTYQHL